MISDLLTLHKELGNAASESERKERASSFQSRVEAEVSNLFAHYPNRRRTFGAIRKRLGVFEPDDPELKAILFHMGALVHKGEGEEALWELPLIKGGRETSVKPRKRWNVYRLASLAIVIAMVLFVANLLSAALTEKSLFQWAQSLWEPNETHAQCISKSNGVMTEFLICHQEFGLLQRP